MMGIRDKNAKDEISKRSFANINNEELERQRRVVDEVWKCYCMGAAIGNLRERLK